MASAGPAPPGSLLPPGGRRAPPASWRRPQLSQPGSPSPTRGGRTARRRSVPLGCCGRGPFSCILLRTVVRARPGSQAEEPAGPGRARSRPAHARHRPAHIPVSVPAPHAHLPHSPPTPAPGSAGLPGARVEGDAAWRPALGTSHSTEQSKIKKLSSRLRADCGKLQQNQSLRFSSCCPGALLAARTPM